MSQPPTQVGGTGWETDIAVNPCDNRQAIGVWVPSVRMCPVAPLCESLEGLSYTTDAGENWTPYNMLDRWQVDPTVTFHPYGTYAFSAVMHPAGDANGVRRAQFGAPFQVSNLSVVESLGSFAVDRTAVAAGISR